jgi:hypothetical protein
VRVDEPASHASKLTSANSAGIRSSGRPAAVLPGSPIWPAYSKIVFEKTLQLLAVFCRGPPALEGLLESDLESLAVLLVVPHVGIVVHTQGVRDLAQDRLSHLESGGHPGREQLDAGLVCLEAVQPLLDCVDAFAQLSQVVNDARLVLRTASISPPSLPPSLNSFSSRKTTA